MNCVVLGGDVAEGADDHASARVRIVDVAECDVDPQSVSVAIRHGRRQRALRLCEQLGEGRRGLPVSVGIAVGVRPPGVDRFVGQPVDAVPENLGECRVDLDDGAVIVADEERLLH